MDTAKIIGLEGGQDATWFKVLAEEGRGTSKYYPAVVDGIELGWSYFESFDDYLAHKVERERETIRFTVQGNPVVAEEAISQALGCKALATTPTSVDVFPGQSAVSTPNAAAALGHLKSDAKAEAARLNGKKGGRPRNSQKSVQPKPDYFADPITALALDIYHAAYQPRGEANPDRVAEIESWLREGDLDDSPSAEELAREWLALDNA